MSRETEKKNVRGEEGGILNSDGGDDDFMEERSTEVS